MTVTLPEEPLFGAVLAVFRLLHEGTITIQLLPKLFRRHNFKLYQVYIDISMPNFVRGRQKIDLLTLNVQWAITREGEGSDG